VPFGALSPTAATVTGAVNAHGLAATVWFEYGRTNAYGKRTPSMQVAASITDQAVSAHLTGLASGVRYHFRLVATSAAGAVAGPDKSFGTPSIVVDGYRCTIVGTQGSDVLVGTPGRDVICGLAGNDVIHGGGGNDIIIGGPGNDVLWGGPGNDTLIGGAGNDILRGNAGADILNGGPGNDKLLGGPGIDTLDGGPGSDTAYAAGKDHVVRVERRVG
jgi:Ca2+-binding RTX toxin-like protein